MKKRKAVANEPVQNNKNKQEEKKKPRCVLYEEFYDFLSHGNSILTNLTASRFANELITWAKDNDDAFKIQQWLAMKGIGFRCWTRWCDKYPEIDQANRAAKMIIGNRREVGVIQRKLEPGHTMYAMPIYDEEYKDLVQWRSNLTKKSEDDTGRITVIMQEAGNSELVPEKKEEE